MESARYFVPDHPKLVDVYSRDELRAFLQRGLLSRSDIVCDDETGYSHLLGDLLSQFYHDAKIVTLRDSDTDSGSVAIPLPAPTSNQIRPRPKQNTLINREFRADTPLSNVRSHDPSKNSIHASDHQNLITPSSTPSHPSYDDDVDHEDQDHYDEDEARLSPGGLDLRFPSSPAYSPYGNTPEPAQGIAKIHRDPLDADEPPRIIDVNSIPSSREEELLYMGHPSWFAFPKSLLGFMVFLTATYYVWKYHIGFDWLMFLGSGAGFFLAYIILERTSTAYYVTTHRVEYEFGILGRSTKEVRIRDIRAIDVDQKGLKALLGLGTVEFDSSASTGPEVVFNNVRNPHRIKELVRSLQLHH